MIILIISDGGINNERNTLDAILLTKNIDYIDGIKLDIYLTKDNYFVLANDNNLNTFTLSNKKINELDYKYLRKVKFPSHIFNYYIPTLSEVLNKYTTNKIIILDIHLIDINDINKVLNNLLNLMNNYSYKYYFIINDNFNINDNIKEKILNKDSYIYLNNINYQDEINKNLYIITKYPKKIYNYLLYRQN